MFEDIYEIEDEYRESPLPWGAPDKRITPERSMDYQLLLDYFVYVKKLSLDDAHREVDAIVRYVRSTHD